MKVIAVAGTWAWKSPWWKDGSPFWDYMARHDIEPMRAGRLPFEWSTDLADSWKFWKKRRSDWEAGGAALLYYVDAADIAPSDTVVIAHSHGGQVVFHAAARGLKIDRLITVATPVRADMAETIAAARPNIRRWMHLCDAESDRTAFWGAFGDRRIGNVREFTQADRVVRVKRIGHSTLLNDYDKFPLWDTTGAVRFLQGA